jgi:hypothetical protein
VPLLRRSEEQFPSVLRTVQKYSDEAANARQQQRRPDFAEASNCGTLERSGLADAEAAFERPTDMVSRMEAMTANRSDFRARSSDHADLSILILTPAHKCEF